MTITPAQMPARAAWAQTGTPPRLAYSTTTGQAPAGPSERDRRCAQAALDEIHALTRGREWSCCPECDLPQASSDRLHDLRLVVETYVADCRAAGVPIRFTR